MDSPPLPSNRIGMSFRTDLANFFDADSTSPPLDFAEVHIEAHQTANESLTLLMDRQLPITLHSTSINIFGPNFLQNSESIDLVGQLADMLDVETISTHLASHEGSVGRIRSFFRPAYSAELLDLTISRMEQAEIVLGKPFAVENIAIYSTNGPDDIDEIKFLNEIAAARPRRLIFDISNFSANAENGFADMETMEALSTENVVYFHISGGRVHKQLFVDTHGDAIPERQLESLSKLRNQISQLDVLYERDVRFEKQQEISSDLDAIESIVKSLPSPKQPS